MLRPKGRSLARHRRRLARLLLSPSFNIPIMAWEVLHAETREHRRRQGIGTMLYDRIAAFLDTKLWPSGWLSDDGYRFWQKRNGEAVQWHRQLDYLPGLWLVRSSS